MFSGFREFIMRGNVIDLAVAVVIGAAFGASEIPSVARRCPMCTQPQVDGRPA